ncbi:innexin-3 family protein, partial [Cooperia oncophora]
NAFLFQCWVPAQFTGAWEKYAETYCFIKGSYFLPDDEHPNEDFIERDNAVIGYYQWVPLVLALQAFLFYAPCVVWKALNCSTGINVKDVLENTAKVKKNVTTKERENQVFKAAVHLKEALELQRELKAAGMIVKNAENRAPICPLSMSSRNFSISAFSPLSLERTNTFWGWEIFSDIWSGREWNVTGHFPRVTMCDFTVRVLGALHRWTVQCVLMINMFTEKIYVFLWFWFILVGTLSVISLIYWVVALVGTNFQRGFVTKYLRCMGEISDEPTRVEEEKVSGFVRNYLTSDGVFLLRLIQTNGGDMLAGEIIASMFRQYNERRKAPMSDDSFGDSPDTTATLPR